MELVSIIVPVYKVEKYLHRCIDSILSQTYENFELILVDDGSPDNSGIICDEYAKYDSRVRVIHQDNLGPSSARNAGIVFATGNWITFVDSDDYIAKEYLLNLIDVASDSNCLIMQGLCKCKGNEIIEVVDFGYKEFTVSNISDAFERDCIFEKGYTVGKLYFREILIKNNIRFNCSISYAEDMIFMLQYIEHINRIIFIKGSNYFYQITASVLSKRVNSFASEYVLFNEYMLSIDRLCNKFHFVAPNETMQYGALLLMRAIYSLYLQDLKGVYIKLNHLRIKYKKFISSYYRPKPVLMKILRLLFIKYPIVFHICCKYKFAK